jgi:hypothetical protein
MNYMLAGDGRVPAMFLFGLLFRLSLLLAQGPDPIARQFMGGLTDHEPRSLG